MNIKTQTGFTIVELIIVIAVSAMLITSITIWQGSINERARFSDAIENLMSQLEESRTAVFSTVGQEHSLNCAGNQVGLPPPFPQTNRAGRNQNCVIFAKVVEFTPNSNVVVVKTVIANRAGDDTFDDELGSLREITALESRYQIKWGVEFRRTDPSHPNAIAFTRNFYTGDLEVYTFNTNLASIDNIDNYDYPARTQRSFLFESPEGQTAEIRVNERRNSISRHYNIGSAVPGDDPPSPPPGDGPTPPDDPPPPPPPPPPAWCTPYTSWMPGCP